MLKRRIVLLLVITLAASMFLAGCTGPSGVDAPTTNNPARGKGNVLYIGLHEPDGIFNPVLGTTVYDRYVNELVFDYLIEIDESGDLVTDGALAERWEISENGKEYTFYLKKGIKFHDGVEFTAEDVAFTLEMIMHPEYTGTQFYMVEDIIGAKDRRDGKIDHVPGIQILDDYTIKIVVEKATAKTLRDIANRMIIPKHYYEKDSYLDFEMLNLKPLGTGPYVFDRYVTGQFVEFNRNENYWWKKPKIEKIIYRCVTADAEIAELQAGGVDAVNFTGTDENVQMVEDTDHAYIIEYMNNGYAYVGINHRHPALSDVRVRQALTYGLNRHAFIDSFFKGRGSVAQTPFSPVGWAYPDESKINDYRYNPEKAKELLEEAGWKVGNDGFRYKDGQRLELTLTTYQNVAWTEQISALMQQNWKDIGVKLDIQFMEFNSVVQKVRHDQEFDLFTMAWGLTPDPDCRQIFHSNNNRPGESNSGHYNNPKVDDLLEKGLLEFDQEKRREIYEELAIEMNRDLPYIFIYIRNNYWGVNERVKNFNPSEFLYWSKTSVIVEAYIEE